MSSLISAKKFSFEILYDGSVWLDNTYHGHWMSKERRQKVTRGKSYFWPRRIVKDNLYETYLDFCKDRGYGEVNTIAFGKAVANFCGFNGNNIKITVNGIRKPGYELPPLDRAREIFRTSEPGLRNIHWPLPNQVEEDETDHGSIEMLKSREADRIDYILDERYDEMEKFEEKVERLNEIQKRLDELREGPEARSS